MSLFSTVFTGTIPYKLYSENGEAFCHWLNTMGKRFDEPFFDETILSCRALPGNARPVKCISPVAMLPEWSAGMNTIRPTAFIFHLSRCGSTLVSQLLTQDPANVVLSEVPFFDELLRLHYQLPGITTDMGDAWLASAIKFYGQKRNAAEEHLFIKADCWHIFFYERLRKLYPDVPFVVLYRSPDEVLRSQQKKRGMQAVPGIIEPEVMGIKKEEIPYHDFDQYFCMVMEKILLQFNLVVENDRQVLPVNYNEGILAVVKKIAAYTGLTISDGLLQTMEERSRYHAKFPGEAFTGDAPLQVQPAYLANCMNLYRELEERRQLTASVNV